MALLVFAFGALFGALFAFNNLIRTLARAQKVTFFEVLLAFLTALTLLTALLVNNTAETPDPYIEWITLLACGALAAFSLLIMLLEAFRPQRLRASRGVLGLFSALLIALASFAIPFAAAFLALEPPDTPRPTARVANVAVTSEADNADDLGTPDLTPTINPDDQAQVIALFQGIRRIVAQEIDVPEEEVFRLLDTGMPLSEIIEENGGDVENVVRELTALMRGSIEESVARGSVNRIQAALLSSQMGTFIRVAISNDLNTLGQRFGGPTPDPQATRASLVLLLTQLPPLDAPVPTNAPDQSAPTERSTTAPTAIQTAAPTEIPSATPTLTPALTETAGETASPALTRTPRPTLTPIPSVTPLVPLTLPPTPLPGVDAADDGAVSPAPPVTRPAAVCFASVNYNLRLRTEPTRDAETILVIPYLTTLELYARNSDATWWLTRYEGRDGWIDGQFVTLSPGCANLPAR